MVNVVSMSGWVGAMEICHPAFWGISLILGNIFDRCGNHWKGMNEATEFVGAGGGGGTFFRHTAQLGETWQWGQNERVLSP